MAGAIAGGRDGDVEATDHPDRANKGVYVVTHEFARCTHTSHACDIGVRESRARGLDCSIDLRGLQSGISAAASSLAATAFGLGVMLGPGFGGVVSGGVVSGGVVSGVTVAPQPARASRAVAAKAPMMSRFITRMQPRPDRDHRGSQARTHGGSS